MLTEHNCDLASKPVECIPGDPQVLKGEEQECGRGGRRLIDESHKKDFEQSGSGTSQETDNKSVPVGLEEETESELELSERVARGKKLWMLSGLFSPSRCQTGRKRGERNRMV